MRIVIVFLGPAALPEKHSRPAMLSVASFGFSSKQSPVFESEAAARGVFKVPLALHIPGGLVAT